MKVLALIPLLLAAFAGGIWVERAVLSPKVEPVSELSARPVSVLIPQGAVSAQGGGDEESGRSAETSAGDFQKSGEVQAYIAPGKEHPENHGKYPQYQ